MYKHKVDLIYIIFINGHSHILMDKAEYINNKIIHMSGCYGENLGYLEFNYNGGITNFSAENIKVTDVEMDKEIIEILQKNKVIAKEKLSVPLYSINRDIWHDVVEENPITNLLADALKDKLKCDIGLINSGVINGGIRRGNVSFGKLIEICPSPLNATSMEVKGKYIKEALSQTLDSDVCYRNGKGPGCRGKYLGRLHISGALIKHDGKNIKSILINGQELQDEKLYKVATADNLQRGTGYPSLANNENPKYEIEYLRIILKEYLCKETFVQNAFKDRWIIENKEN